MSARVEMIVTNSRKTGAAAGAGAAHPLDPLTAEEIGQVATILRRRQGIGAGWRFASIELKEPGKDASQSPRGRPATSPRGGPGPLGNRAPPRVPARGVPPPPRGDGPGPPRRPAAHKFLGTHVT